MLKGCTVTIDAMGTQANIAQAIRKRGADYVLAVKDNQPRLAESIQDFWNDFRVHPEQTPHSFHPPRSQQEKRRHQGQTPHRRHLG